MFMIILSFVLGWFGRWRYLGLLFIASVGFTAYLHVNDLSLRGITPILILLATPALEVVGGYFLGSGFYRLRRGEWPHIKLHREWEILRKKEADAIRQSIAVDSEAPITWEANVPLLTNPVILRAAGIVLSITFVFVSIIFFIISRRGGLGQALMISGAAVAVLGGLIIFVLIFVLTNRVRMLYCIGKNGYYSKIVDGRLNLASLASISAGAGTSSPTTAGAGLIAIAQDIEYQPWSRVRKAAFDPQRHRIVLSFGRLSDILYCSRQSYPLVSEQVRILLPHQVMGD